MHLIAVTFCMVFGVAFSCYDYEYMWTDEVDACLQDLYDHIKDGVRSFDDCRKECVEATKFTCKSVEYHPTSRRCVLSGSSTLYYMKDFLAPCDEPGWRYSERQLVELPCPAYPG